MLGSCLAGGDQQSKQAFGYERMTFLTKNLNLLSSLRNEEGMLLYQKENMGEGRGEQLSSFSLSSFLWLQKILIAEDCFLGG